MPNYHHPAPRCGEPKVDSSVRVPFPMDRLDPADPVENSWRLDDYLRYNNELDTFCRKMATRFKVNLKRPKQINISGTNH